jgi:4-hydroxy-3-polyprenylbenzoate decarboxylase
MQRIIVGISGASGAIYGIRALEILRTLGVETHLVLSPSAGRTITEETDLSLEQVHSLASQVHSFKDIGATIASGSFKVDGMLVAPCSVKTLSAIAHCATDELIARAADVQLKERRRVVLLFRETPLHAGHIALMERATMNGAVIMPPVPAFYHRPKTIDDIVTQTVGRALDLFGIDAKVVHRWDGGERGLRRVTSARAWAANRIRAPGPMRWAIRAARPTQTRSSASGPGD